MNEEETFLVRNPLMASTGGGAAPRSGGSTEERTSPPPPLFPGFFSRIRRLRQAAWALQA